MTSAELLQALNDIQEPGAPAWWQLAPVWWSLLGLFLAATVLYRLAQHWRHYHRNHRIASDRLKAIRLAYSRQQDKALLVLDLSRWLKQVALLANPRQGVEGMTGQRWVAHLSEVSGLAEFCRGPGEVFAGRVYCADPAVDAAALINLCERWLEAIRPRLRQAEGN